MKKSLAVALAAAALATLGAGKAQAILFGTPDGNDHRGVGYIVFYDSANVPLWRCTGSLVSTRVVLTAGHCAGVYDNSTGFHKPVLAQVWFDKQVRSGDSNYPSAGGVPCSGFRGFPCSGGDAIGVPVPHPDYQGSQENGTSEDIGVVVLTKQMKSRDVVDLAPVGTLEQTAARSPVTLVGFGTQSPTPPPADQRQRMRGVAHFLRVEDGSQPDDEAPFADFTNFQAAGAVACVGDSGGPVLDEQDEIVSVVALVDSDPADSPYGDNYCQGIAFHTRTDTADAQQFLARFGVRVPDASDGHGDHGNGHGDNGHGGHGHHGHHGRGFTDE